MIGQSSAFLETLQLAKKTACCDAPVLFERETGTGKELVARAIHCDSDRKKLPFIPINCGAYTGAQSDNSGLISQAQHGTLLLDEVDSLSPDSLSPDSLSPDSLSPDSPSKDSLSKDPPSQDPLSPKVQVTLLRFMQDHVYRPLGGSEPCSADVRFIVASNTRFRKKTIHSAVLV